MSSRHSFGQFVSSAKLKGAVGVEVKTEEKWEEKASMIMFLFEVHSSLILIEWIVLTLLLCLNLRKLIFHKSEANELAIIVSFLCPLVLESLICTATAVPISL
ncbi:hypothetical protein COLO4_37438 [Corchorus olitorius]|uniref:Uncharacterized protein n=1 Tax=Corchorus olitorius TaxID=93759 RepID=A0A1R3G1U7_9ROSI|nr:hypothetical protein COLO4_37438 [Corchorus olitorius]